MPLGPSIWRLPALSQIWMPLESLTDGYLQRLHLAPDSYDRQRALAASKVCLGRLVPGLTGR